MVVSEMKCGMCGRRFEAELLDRDNPKERNVRGVPMRCPQCSSTMLEMIRVLRRVARRAS